MSGIPLNKLEVNLIESTTEDDSSAYSATSEKCAVFVVDGIQYTLKGRVSMDTMKEIIDSFH